MEISTDIRVELISTVIYLANMQSQRIVVSQDDLGSDAIDNWFKDFRNHSAVTMFPELWEQGLWWGEIPRLALYMTDDIFLQAAFWQEYNSEYWPSETKQKIIDFVQQLQDFYFQSSFRRFYTDTLSGE